jgi:hypothetical protein
MRNFNIFSTLAWGSYYKSDVGSFYAELNQLVATATCNVIILATYLCHIISVNSQY